MPTIRKAPEEHQTSVVRPADFDEFWAAIMDEVNQIPLNPRMEHIPMRSTHEVDVYEIHYDSLDNVRIAGWYCRPRESYLKPPYPALVLVPGYVSEPTLPKSWAKMGYAAVGVAPRGKLRSNRQFNPGYPNLMTNNIIDRNTYTYRGFYVDAARAVDFALSRPEVDQSRVGVHGSSQGGALTITTSALRADVIVCGAAGAPGMTGFMDAVSLTRSDGYEEINDYLRMHPDHEKQVRETLNYFDCINFAPWVKAPMLVYIGLADHLVAPETSYDLVKALTCPTELIATPRSAHEAGRKWVMPKVEEFLNEHLKPAAAGLRAEPTVG